MKKTLKAIAILYHCFCSGLITLIVLLLLLFGGSVKIHIDFDSLTKFSKALSTYIQTL